MLPFHEISQYYDGPNNKPLQHLKKMLKSIKTLMMLQIYHAKQRFNFQIRPHSANTK